KFLRNEGTGPPLHAADETGSERGASPPWRVCRRARLAYQEPFVSVVSAMVTVPDGDSEFVWRMGSAGGALLSGAAGCSRPPRAERTTAASILARTLRARRVLATSGKSTLAPVVRMRDPAVGPIASSAATQTRPTPPQIAPVVESTHRQHATPSPANRTTPRTIRHNQPRAGQTTTDSTT